MENLRRVRQTAALGHRQKDLTLADIEPPVLGVTDKGLHGLVRTLLAAPVADRRQQQKQHHHGHHAKQHEPIVGRRREPIRWKASHRSIAVDLNKMCAMPCMALPKSLLSDEVR